VVFAATAKNEMFTEDICDSGACGHYCNSTKGLFNIEEINESITVGTGKSMMANKVGSLKCRMIQVDGSGLEIALNEVKYVPELWVNLCSINKALKKGYKLRNKGLSICLSKGDVSVTFDRVLRTANGSVPGSNCPSISPLLLTIQSATLDLERASIYMIFTRY
jgi:hypothetical protein